MATKRSLLFGLVMIIGLLQYSAQSQLLHSTCHFPDSFYFGAATGAYQVEGAHNTSGKGPSIWDTFTHEHPEKIADGSNGDVAADFYNNYKEDIKRMSVELGMNAFEFSISWARVIPNGMVSKGVNEEGIAFYNSLIDESIIHGLEPFATLFHWDVPQALVDEYGGFLSRNIVADFKDFAELCFQRFGDRVKHWITISEPYEISISGYDKGLNAPGRCSSWVDRTCLGGDSATEPYRVAHNLLLAHAEAVYLFRTKYQEEDSEIGICLDLWWAIPLSNSLADYEAAKRYIDFQFGWFMDPLTHGDYPRTMRTLVPNRLPKFTREESELVKKSYDFIGINSYTSIYASANFTADPDPTHISASTDNLVTTTPYRDGTPIGKQATPNWLYVFPEGILYILNYTKNTYNDPKIYITENGIGDAINLTMEEAAKDVWRMEYHGKHLSYVCRAIREYKVNVQGYFFWALMDNFEWTDGYSVRMGLYGVDRNSKDLKRIPKLSAKKMKKFLNGCGTHIKSTPQNAIGPNKARHTMVAYSS